MNLKLKIPQGISLSIAAKRREKRAIAVLLVWKSLYGDEASRKSQKLITEQIAEITGLCPRTVLNRLYDLKAMNLAGQFISLLPNGNIDQLDTTWEPVSYKKILQHYGIYNRRSHYVRMKECDPVNYIDAMALKEKQSQCMTAYKYKVNRDVNLNQELSRAAGCIPTDAPRVLNSQLDLYSNPQHYDPNEAFALNLINANPNMNCSTLGRLYGYESRGGMSYKKRKMKALQIWAISESIFELPLPLYKSTASREFPILGSAYYSRADRKLKLVLPDTITFVNA